MYVLRASSQQCARGSGHDNSSWKAWFCLKENKNTAGWEDGLMSKVLAEQV